MFILDALAGYTARDPDEAKGIADRVLPRLTHANSAVVLSAIKVFSLFLSFSSFPLLPVISSSHLLFLQKKKLCLFNRW